MSKALRFWLCPADEAIRIELADGDSTFATLSKFGDELKWQYGTPDERIDAQCHEAVLYQYAFDFAKGFAFGGFETLAEMDRQCSARCQECHKVQASHHELSNHGLCTRCFVRGMAA